MATETAPPVTPRADRAPPYSEEAERAVLGSALLDAARVVDLCLENQIVPESFYVRSHAIVFETLLDMITEGRPVDLLTVADQLRSSRQLDAIGGAEFLDRLVDSTPTAAHAEYYGQIVHANHLLRSMIHSAQDTIEGCYRGEEEASEILNRAEQAFFAISDVQRSSMRPWADLIKGAMEEVETIFRTKQGATGLLTGYRDIDRTLLGLHNSDMIILAARPSQGKTALALNIAERVATPNPEDPDVHPVAVFSIEMSADQLVRRMLCSRARVPSHKLVGGYIGEVSHRDLTSAASALQKAPIYIDDTAGLSVLEMRSRARRMKRKNNIELIIIDYLQMMNYPQYSREGRQRETAAISGAVKAMAKELKVPVLVLSQLSRGPETRDRKAVPRLSDLRDSGSLEQDADVVCLLRRPCKYPDDPESEDKMLAIVDVAKHRNGPTGEVKLNFIDELTRFEDRAHGVDGIDGGGVPREYDEEADGGYE